MTGISAYTQRTLTSAYLTVSSLKVALYLRVSTSSQTTDNQRLELERVAALRSWTITEIYTDHGISGTKGRSERPDLDRMLLDAVRGRLI